MSENPIDKVRKQSEIPTRREFIELSNRVGNKIIELMKDMCDYYNILPYPSIRVREAASSFLNIPRHEISVTFRGNISTMLHELYHYKEALKRSDKEDIRKTNNNFDRFIGEVEAGAFAAQEYSKWIDKYEDLLGLEYDYVKMRDELHMKAW